MNKFIIGLVCLTLFVSPILKASDTGEILSSLSNSEQSTSETIMIGGVGALIVGLLGSKWELAGAGAIVTTVGVMSLSGDRDNRSYYSDILFNEQTKFALYTNGKSLDDSSNRELPVVEFNLSESLKVAEMEAILTARNSGLVTNSTLQEFATTLGITSQRLASVLVTGKSLADKKLGNKQFAAEAANLDTESVTSVIGDLSEAELRIIKNYLRLRNIHLT